MCMIVVICCSSCIFLFASSVIIDDELSQLPENAILHNNDCEGSFGMLDYVNRTKQNLSFLFKETIVMSVKNDFFVYFDGLRPNDQKLMLKKAHQEQERVLDVVKEDGITEATLRQERAEETINATTAKCAAMAKKEFELRRMIGVVPSCQAEYKNCLNSFIEKSNSTEWMFLKFVLQLQKLVDKRNMSASAFTVSHGGIKLSTSALRDKLFCLYK